MPIQILSTERKIVIPSVSPDVSPTRKANMPATINIGSHKTSFTTHKRWSPRMRSHKKSVDSGVMSQ